MAPVTTEYYDLLGVSSDAEGVDIRRAYYRTALEYHPNKNKSPGVKEKYKEINKAYQVLSNPKLRAKYDKNKEPMADEDYVDIEEYPVAFFIKTFGGDSSVPYVGDTVLGKITNMIIEVTEMKDSNHILPSVTRTEPTGTLEEQLIERLQLSVENNPDIEVFEEKMRKEAEKMKLETFGVELLRLIGFVYRDKATSFLNSNRFNPLSGVASLAKGGWKRARGSAETVMKLRESETLGDALGRVIYSGAMGVAWEATRFECVQILKKVCDEVLKPSKAPESVLTSRAEGMLQLGNIFKGAQPDGSDPQRRELERLAMKAFI